MEAKWRYHSNNILLQIMINLGRTVTNDVRRRTQKHTQSQFNICRKRRMYANQFSFVQFRATDHGYATCFSVNVGIWYVGWTRDLALHERSFSDPRETERYRGRVRESKAVCINSNMY